MGTPVCVWRGSSGGRQQRAALPLQGRAPVPHSWTLQGPTNCDRTSLPCLDPALISRLSQPSVSPPCPRTGQALGPG